MIFNTPNLKSISLKVALIFSLFLHLTGFYFLSSLTFDSIKAVPELKPIIVRTITDRKAMKPLSLNHISQQTENKKIKKNHPISRSYQKDSLPYPIPLYKTPVQIKANQFNQQVKISKFIDQISLAKNDSSSPKVFQSQNNNSHPTPKAVPRNFKAHALISEETNIALKPIGVLDVPPINLINDSLINKKVVTNNKPVILNKANISHLLVKRGPVKNDQLTSSIRLASDLQISFSQVASTPMLINKQGKDINKTNQTVQVTALSFHEEMLKGSKVNSVATNSLSKYDSFSGDDIGKIRQGFRKTIWNKVASVKYYPGVALKRGFEGKPVVSFTLGIRGELLKLNLVQSSDYNLLNEAALETIRRGSPYPPIPKPLRQESISFKLPISYIMK